MKFILPLILIIIVACKKTPTNESIAGRWEITNVKQYRSKPNDIDYFEDFKKDLYYLKEIIFYKDSLFYIDYPHGTPQLGVYKISTVNSDIADFEVFIRHEPFINEGYPHKFDFNNMHFFITKHTENKLILSKKFGNSPSSLLYDHYELRLKRTGVF